MMARKSKKKRSQGKKTAFLLFFLVVLIVGLYSVFSSDYTLVLSPENTECPIEYGELECIDGQAVVPFFNPNKIDLTEIKIQVPKSNGVDIYNVDAPLRVNATETLTLHTVSCPTTMQAEQLKISWCCLDECYESLLTTPTEGFEIFINDPPEISYENETYSEYPTQEECNSLHGHVKKLCLDDLAEINNDPKKCELIDDEDIKKHCIGRITLNESMCNEIGEEGLRSGCLESISFKRNWSANL